MLIKALLFVWAVSCASPLIFGQVVSTASRAGDLQIGGTLSLADSDYSSRTLAGFGFYSTFDFKSHYGIEAEFHQLNDRNTIENIYERTYEVGPRYVLHYGRFAPFAKAMIGRGVFNFPPAVGDPTGEPAANLAYTMWAAGVGSDYQVRPSLNVRAECEFQQWGGFPSPGLAPRIVDIGVAYHFH